MQVLYFEYITLNKNLSPQFWGFDPQNLSLPILMTIAVTYLKEK